ncbi:uncharacterized protein B0I36DRAFT_315789 [Microdochium trichocladiopsis]|uniref:Uncharacterized protein n=1 Tax=Microdochium trichocladiopsis TaxID=1682393 RepID=A0A9P8YEY5_9PEZI|nr:uncharacterized protein B0I36DRAFT_315789 [Microdochium trichocladiopsis]KAH7038210.1 hypothetical protein B0I36DRAFT_315789 [Microdochium trichocladiopsis]
MFLRTVSMTYHQVHHTRVSRNRYRLPPRRSLLEFCLLFSAMLQLCKILPVQNRKATSFFPRHLVNDERRTDISRPGPSW